MTKVIDLLNKNNSILKKILGLSLEFLQISPNDDFMVRLQEYERKRSVLFKILSHQDSQLTTESESALKKAPKIAQTTTTLEPEPALSDTIIEEIKAQLEIRDELTQSILKADDHVIQAIHTERIKLHDAAQGSQRNMQQLSKFKSSWVADTGEQLDGLV